MAKVIHRTTLTILDSVNTPDYDPTEWLVNPDLKNVEGIPSKYWKIVGDEIIVKDKGEQDQADADELPELKLRLLDAVDNKAESTIVNGPGLEHPVGSGKYISTSLAAQVKWTGWNAIADNWEALGFPYPFRVRTRGDEDYVEVKDANEVREVYGRMAQMVAVILSEVEVVKTAIQQATTIQEAEDAAAPYLNN